MSRIKEAAGAMHEPDGTCIHAAKLAFGYQNLARKLGAKVHPASPVMGWKIKNGVHHLTHTRRHGAGPRRGLGDGGLYAARA